MKKLLAVLALLLVASMLLVACQPEQPPVEETTPEETTPEVTTPEETTPEDTTPEETTPEETTPEETTPEETTPEETTPPVDPVKVGQSLDECDMFIAGESVGAFFTPGQSTSWDLVATVEDYNVEAIRVWGWVAFYAETPGTFGYQIDGGDIVYDDAFSVEAEEPVVNAALAQGGKSAARMKVFVPVRDLSGEHTIKVVAKDAVGTVETIVEFTMNKAVDPNAPIFFIPAADMASSIPGSPDVTSAEMSADGSYITITTGEVGDPYYQLPMINGKGYQATHIAIKYRTTVPDIGGQIFIGSGAGPNGAGDNPTFDYVSDGKWHVVVIPLADVASITEAGINYLRWDMYQRGQNNQIDMAYIAAFNSEEAAYLWDARFADVYVDTLNIPTSDWTVSGHNKEVCDSSNGMVAAGGVEYGALLHQGYVSLGELDLAQFSKIVILYGLDGSQVTIDHYNASAANRIILTSADQEMTNSPTEDVIIASVDYVELGWNIKAIEIDLTDVDYAGPVFITYDTLPGTFMLIAGAELTYDPNYVPPVPPAFIDKAEAGMKGESCDTVTLNDGMYFAEDGGAYDKLAAVENKITVTAGDVVGFRGWIGFNQAFDQFGYIIDGVFYGGDYAKDTEDVIYTIAGEHASRYHITIDTAGVPAADYVVTWGAKLADGTVVGFYTVTITVEEAPVVENYNVPQDQWTVSGHCPQIVGKEGHGNSPMVAAGGIDSGALLHQGSVGVGEIDLSKYSKAVIYIGIDNSGVTMDHHANNAANRIMLTNADVSMVMSPEAGQIVASVDYTPCGWAITAFEIDLTGVDYNGPVFVTYDTLPGTFMLIGAIEFVA